MVKLRFAVLAVLVIVLDQFSKWAARAALSRPITLIPSFFSLEHIQNTGASFGILQNQNLLLLIIGIIFSLALLLFYSWIPKDAFHQTGIALILGGAVGNTLDRIFLGSVTDFISFAFWPAFNIADAAITIGVLLIIFPSFSKKRSGAQPLSPSGKKGQVSLFLVLGLVILFGLFFVFFIRGEVTSTQSSAETSQSIASSFELAPIKSYVTDCLQKSAEAGIRDIGKHGGYLSGEDFRLTLNPHTDNEEALDTKNYLTGTAYAPHFVADLEGNIRKIKDKLSSLIQNNINDCLNFKGFEKSNIFIKKKGDGIPDIEVLIAPGSSLWKDTSFSVRLTLPLSIQKDRFHGGLETFQTTVPVRISGMLGAALKLVNGLRDAQLALQPPDALLPYDISKNCGSLTDRQVNIEFLSETSVNPRSGVVRISDYSALDTFLKKTFQYEFGVRNVYITGECK